MIKVLLFAHLKDQAGVENVEINESKITVKHLLDHLTHHYPLAKLENVMVAINEEYATEEDVVKSGDTVALIPPVSGG
jgi:sulfur-carrier protein